LLWLSHAAVKAGFGFAFQILAFLQPVPARRGFRRFWQSAPFDPLRSSAPSAVKPVLVLLFKFLALLATCPGAPWIPAILAILSLFPKVFSFPLDTVFLQDFPQESF